MLVDAFKNLTTYLKYKPYKIKSFKYQITKKALLGKEKQNEVIEFPSVCFNFTNKTVINFKYNIENFFQEVLPELTIELMKDLITYMSLCRC